MVCLECQGVFKKISNTHLRKCCGLTEAEYLAKHPGAELVDQEIRKSYGMALENNPNWRGGASFRFCQTCGKRISKAKSVNYCRKCSQAIKGNGFSGKSHSDVSRWKMVASAKTRDKATYHHFQNTPEELSRRRKEYWAKCTPEDKSRQLAKFIEAGQRTNKKNIDTKIERLVSDWLTEFEINFVHPLNIQGMFVDFLVGDLVIECFGDYWHCNPKLYPGDVYHKSLHMTCEEKRQKDAMRLRQLEILGYRTLVLWESNIKDEPEMCRTDILKAIGK